MRSCAVVDLAGVEGVALDDAELAADDPVEGAGVAGDVDALDEDPVALEDLEVDVDRPGGLVAGDARADLDEGVAGLARLVGHPLDDAIDLGDVVDAAVGDRREERLEGGGVEAGDRRADRHLAEVEALALGDREGEEEAAALARELGGGREHLEVDVAALEVELAQELAVDLEPVGVVGGAAEDEAQPVRLVGLDHPPQAPVGEHPVAGEADPLHRGPASLGDLEDEVDPVLRLADDHRVDLGRIAPRRPVGVDDALRVLLRRGHRIGEPRPELHDLGELLVVERVVALEGDLVDRRVLPHGDDEPPGLGHHLHVLEEPGVEQVAHREVQLLGRHRLAGLDAGEDPDRVRLDALVAGDVDPAEDGGALGEGERRRQRHGQHGDQGERAGRIPESTAAAPSASCPSARGRFAALFVNSPCA